MCGYNLCCKPPCNEPVFGGIYSNSAVTYEYEEGELQTVELDVPMYSRGVTAAVGTLTPDTGGYYFVTMSADVLQTAGNTGDWTIELTVDDAPEMYYTTKIKSAVGTNEALSKTGIVHIAANAPVSLKVISLGDPSALEIEDAHLCILKIGDDEPQCGCNCGCNRN
jgi:hypothetical protein